MNDLFPFAIYLVTFFIFVTSYHDGVTRKMHRGEQNNFVPCFIRACSMCLSQSASKRIKNHSHN
jgi:hypothetical protein